MKNQNQKSIEQQALEDYAWKIGTDRLLKANKRFSPIATVVVTMCIFFLHPSSYLFIKIFVGLLCGLGVWPIFKLSFFIFTESCFRGTKKKKLIIASLSDELKKTIIKVFIQRQINQAEQNIAYCNKRIEPQARSIRYSEQQIKELEEKLRTI
jgi:hypothetical protein